MDKQYTLSTKGKQIKNTLNILEWVIKLWSGQIAYKCIIAIQPGPAK